MRSIERKNRKYFVFGTFFYLLSAVIETYWAVVIGEIVDAATAGEMKELVVKTVTAIALMAMMLLLTYIAVCIRSKYMMKSIYGVRSKVYNSIITGKYDVSVRSEDAAYINLLTNDVKQVEEGYFQPRSILGFYVGEFVFALTALFIISWKATISFIVLFMIPMIAPALFSKRLAGLKKGLSEENEKFTFVLKENIMGAGDIIMSLSQKIYGKKYDDENLSERKIAAKARRTESMSEEVATTLGGVAQLGCMAIGGFLVIRKEITVGQLIACIQLLNSVMNPINTISQKISMINSTKPIREKLEAAMADAYTPTEAEKVAGDIECNNVAFSYGDKKIIDNFNCKFEKGKKYAIIGGSGAGKSTLVKLMLGMNGAYGGSIEFAGKDMAKLSPEALYTNITYVPQNIFLFNDTIENNISMGRQVDKKKLDEISKRLKIDYLLDMRTEALGDEGDKLSGGERQRIGLARALYQDAGVLIVDEPTSALDPATAAEIEDILLGLEGYTVIVITHDCREEHLGRYDGVVKVG